jgi:hypothetical protein
MKVPRQYPHVLLVKVGWTGGKTFGDEEGKDERWSREKRWAGFHCIKLEPRIHTLNRGRAVCSDILIFYMGEASEGEILTLILGGLNEKHAVQRGIPYLRTLRG